MPFIVPACTHNPGRGYGSARPWSQIARTRRTADFGRRSGALLGTAGGTSDGRDPRGVAEAGRRATQDHTAASKRRSTSSWRTPAGPGPTRGGHV